MRGDWKLLLSPSSGGWSFPPQEDSVIIKSYLKFNSIISRQIGETKNIYREKPEIVREIRDILIRYIRDGRSTPGAPQRNEGDQEWSDNLIENWMKITN